MNTRSSSVGPQPNKYFDPAKLKSLKGTNAVYVEQLKDLVKCLSEFENHLNESLDSQKHELQRLNGEIRKLKLLRDSTFEESTSKASSSHRRSRSASLHRTTSPPRHSEPVIDFNNTSANSDETPENTVFDKSAPESPDPSSGDSSDSIETSSPELGHPLGHDSARKPPQINMLGLSKSLKIDPFTGDASIPFSYWFRRYSDFGDAQSTAWTDEEKAVKIKFFLDGLAREKYEEIPIADRKTLATIVTKLKEWFESPKLRTLARHNLSQCKQLSGESVNDFVQRLSKAVKAATVGQHDATVKERLLEEFLDKLNPSIAFRVKCTDPDSFEIAHLKAQQLESLLASRAASQTS